MVASGEGTAQDYAVKLSAVFAGAKPGQQAKLAAWLNRQGMPEQTLTLITLKKAAQDAGAYLVRGEALAAMGNWEELRKLGDTACNAPPSMQLSTKAVAAHHLGKSGEAQQALADALRAGTGDGGFGYAVAAAEQTGQRDVVDQVIIETCADAQQSANMFRAARDRFGRRGQFASLAAAYDAAAKAAPDAPAVQDYRRRNDLLAGKPVSLEETAAAIAAAPADQSARFTHALALLKADRAADALGVFHDVDIFVDQLPPGDKAVVIALWETNGMNAHAASLRQSLDPALLQPGEYALIAR
jgi:tetratricopeptide (TPR) repeat protein